MRRGRGKVRGGRHGALDGDELADRLGGLVFRGFRGGWLGAGGEWRQGVRAGVGLGSRVGSHRVGGERGRDVGGGRGRLGRERVFGVRTVRRGSRFGRLRVGRLGVCRGEGGRRRFGGGRGGGGRLCVGVRGGRQYVGRGLGRVRALVLGRGRVHGLERRLGRDGGGGGGVHDGCRGGVRGLRGHIRIGRLGSRYVGSLNRLLGCAGRGEVGDNGLSRVVGGGLDRLTGIRNHRHRHRHRHRLRTLRCLGRSRRGERSGLGERNGLGRGFLGRGLLGEQAVSGRGHVRQLSVAGCGLVDELGTLGRYGLVSVPGLGRLGDGLHVLRRGGVGSRRTIGGGTLGEWRGLSRGHLFRGSRSGRSRDGVRRLRDLTGLRRRHRSRSRHGLRRRPGFRCRRSLRTGHGRLGVPVLRGDSGAGRQNGLRNSTDHIGLPGVRRSRGNRTWVRVRSNSRRGRGSSVPAALGQTVGPALGGKPGRSVEPALHSEAARSDVSSPGIGTGTGELGDLDGRHPHRNLPGLRVVRRAKGLRRVRGLTVLRGLCGVTGLAVVLLRCGVRRDTGHDGLGRADRFRGRLGRGNNRFGSRCPGVDRGLHGGRCLGAPRDRALRGHLVELRGVEVLGAGGGRAGLADRCARGAAVGE